MKRIRQWLKLADDCRRTYVEVEEKTRQKRAEERAIAADARHGILPFAGRRLR